MKKFLLACGLIGLMIFVVACNDSDEIDSNEEEATTVVETSIVEQGDLIVDRVIYGNMSPDDQRPVMAEQPGEVEELFVENGDKIEEDDEIATIKTPMGKQKVKASLDGVIAKLEAKEDTMVSNEDPLAIIVDLEQLNAEFSVTKTMRDLFKKDQKVKIEIDGKEYDGKVQAMDVLPNEQGQFSVIASVKTKGKVLPGAIAKLMLKEKKVKDTLLIPTEAIVMENDDAFVFIVDGNVAKKVAINIEETQSDFTAVSGELTEGDEVITKGQFTLADENEVEVVKEGNES